jgi:hypothetical protein
MPNVLIPGALRSIRLEKKLDRRAAATLLGLNECTIRRHESEQSGPLTLKPSTVRLYMKGYGCTADRFVRFVDRDEAQAIRRPVDDEPGAPRLPTLTLRAQHELALGMKRTIRYGVEDVEVVGPALLHQCMTAFGLYKDRRFAVVGHVKDMRYLPDPASDALSVEPGMGASFRVDRTLVKGVPIYVTVFTTNAKTTQQLVARYEDGQETVLIVDIFVKPAANNWKGFFIFEKTKVPRPWVFVVRDVLDPVLPGG